MHTDLRRTGWFSCSDERLDRFHEAAVWSFRGNACDIPTDCPHRERPAGPATGSCSCRPPRSSTTSPASRRKWLRDVAVDQWPDGTIANISPTPRGEGREGPIAFLNGSAGWGDAAVIVPWEMYRAYGDVQVLDELWPTMVALAGPRRADGPASSGTPPGPRAARSRRRTSSTSWDTGFHWGEWLEPGRGDRPTSARSSPPTRATSPPPTSPTARGLMARIAEVLGREDDADRYAELADGRAGRLAGRVPRRRRAG